ncbi:hypothetical protein GGI21_006695 [Coemansia aciculifera]|nr:hypothetical protein GGI21_006695 [Coemansia aciculifera]
MVLATGGLWLASWFLLLTPDLIPLASLSMVLPNVASTLTTTVTAPRFYRWFYALPFYNGSMLYRYILSGGYPKIGLNLGVCLGELFLWCILLWLSTWVRQYTVICGKGDMVGWYRGNIFFATPVKKEEEEETSSAAPLSITDSANDETSLRIGNLGV